MSKINKVNKYPKANHSSKGIISGAMNTLSKVDTPSVQSNVPLETTKSASVPANTSEFYKKHTHVWLITALTNLHVGNENTSNYGIIDNAIQRDVLTGFPCINSSSLKGALNEFCCVKMDDDNARKQIFGSDKKKKGDSQKGKSIFFDAQLLFLPKQEDKDLYSYVTSDKVLDLFEEKVGLFMSGFTMEKSKEKDCRWDAGLVESFFGLDRSLTIIENGEFVEYCNDENLPIIARNVLENGMSKNLWYEQVLPPRTILCAITIDEDDTLADTINNKIVQIGANATIGYGYCKFTKIKE